MEPDEEPTDCSDESQRYDSLADHPAVLKKQRISPVIWLRSDVLLQRKGHAMKDEIALFVIVILACQISPKEALINVAVRP